MSLTLYNPAQNPSYDGHASAYKRKTIQKKQTDSEENCMTQIHNFQSNVVLQTSCPRESTVNMDDRVVLETFGNSEISSQIDIIEYQNGEQRHVLHGSMLNQDNLIKSDDGIDLSQQQKPLWDISKGSMIYNIESPLIYGDRICQSGFPAQLVSCHGGTAKVLMSSGEVLLFSSDLTATVLKSPKIISKTHTFYRKISPNGDVKLIDSSSKIKELPSNLQEDPGIFEKRLNYPKPEANASTLRKIIKVAAVIGLAIIGFALIDDILNGRIKWFGSSFKEPSKDYFNESSSNINPCTPEISAYKVKIIGKCTHEEIDNAYAESTRLFQEREAQLKEEAQIKIDEYSKKIKKTINKASQIPCIANISPYRVMLSGKCTDEEKEKAYAESDRLFQEREAQLKEETQIKLDEHLKNTKLFKERQAKLREEGKREAVEGAKKTQAMIDKTEADWLERERRRYNPTPEERAADQAEIDKELDRKFKGWPGYVPRYEAQKPEIQECPENKVIVPNPEKYLTLSDIVRASHPDLDARCKQAAGIILNIDPEANCKNEISKKFREISRKIHPDKNPNQKELAEKALISLNNAYETLCPS